ncbi:uncharacterized protein G2W53_004130 [Senna tora]|uniref:Uncharacterized protein n=1 Tax=Senna tora TaxID=362788 RepID=A0A835CJW4_9FABA|nr:uncharacterized protein G2W53_004130 [Senna tora]
MVMNGRNKKNGGDAMVELKLKMKMEEKNTGKKENTHHATYGGGDGGDCGGATANGRSERWLKAHGSNEREGRRRAKRKGEMMVVRWWRERKTPEMKVNVNGGNGGGWRLMVARVERGEEEGKWMAVRKGKKKKRRA